MLVFSKDGMRSNKLRDLLIVCKKDEDLTLSEDEMSVLRLGPKFCEYKNLCDEAFEVEIEQTLMKYKWETRDEENENKIDDRKECSIKRIVL